LKNACQWYGMVPASFFAYMLRLFSRNEKDVVTTRFYFISEFFSVFIHFLPDDSNLTPFRPSAIILIC